ncbi:alpha/beta hydrolase family protein [Alkaliphilus sp. B6464]|uniref:alpha/beta hydrolase family protein n=1 Tax=Alkaliphilus sp. B6464 TaxID=2731219 RepID=UPI001BED9B08|nr:S9 family peptidase [Alkaliphilus sp. B6464]QUH20314.1 S9 family peptidase [Alkaliphilus sp. B6464]
MEKLKLDDFIRYKFLSNIMYSLNGENVSFTVNEADLDNNKYLSNIWIYYNEDNTYRQLTSFNEDKMFLWLEDNETILFSSLRDLNDKEKVKEGEVFTQFYKISINGGEAKKAFRISKKLTSIKQIDDNTYIFTARSNLYNKELDKLSEKERNLELKAQKEEKDYEILDEIPFWSNGVGFTNKSRNRLYIYNSLTNSYNLITDDFTNVSSVNLNDKKDKVIFIGQSFESKMELENSIYVYDLLKQTIEKVATPYTVMHGYANFIDDNKIVYTGKDMVKYGMNENSKFYILDVKEQKTTCITPDLDCNLTNSVGSDCRYGISPASSIQKRGSNIYFISTEGECSYLNKLDINGEINKMTSSNGSIDDFSVNDKGDVLFIGLRDTKLQEMYLLKDNKEHQISEFNRWVKETKSIIKPEKITVETSNNIFIDGWIMRPVDFQEGKKYPAILDIHGGPKTVYGEIFYHEMQYWANEGYVVFFCNPRGSDGKGNNFADIRGKYGTIDYDDIMKFTDAVLEKYTFIDKDKVGVTGGSYGGFMTNWIIGHTDRFKAAASQRSISNWISKFGTTDIGYYFNHDQIGATPWDNQEKLWDHSPLKYAHRAKTPTLFIHSEEDYRCWLVEGIQMFTALKYHNVEARLCMFRGENHELSRSGKPKHRIRRLKEITDWFDKYLK